MYFTLQGLGTQIHGKAIHTKLLYKCKNSVSLKLQLCIIVQGGGESQKKTQPSSALRLQHGHLLQSLVMGHSLKNDDTNISAEKIFNLPYSQSNLDSSSLAY